MEDPYEFQRHPEEIFPGRLYADHDRHGNDPDSIGNYFAPWTLFIFLLPDRDEERILFKEL